MGIWVFLWICFLLYLAFLFFRFLYRAIIGTFGKFHETRIGDDLRAISIKTPFSFREPLLPYHKRDYLLSVAEKNFYDVLKKVANEHQCEVFAKVRLEDLLWIPHYTKQLLKWRGYIRSRHIDFVLCDAKNISPLCAVELDDASHNTPAVIRRDDIVNRILGCAGLPLLRIKVSYSYDPALLGREIDMKITNGNIKIPVPARGFGG